MGMNWSAAMELPATVASTRDAAMMVCFMVISPDVVVLLLGGWFAANLSNTFSATESTENREGLAVRCWLHCCGYVCVFLCFLWQRTINAGTATRAVFPWRSATAAPGRAAPRSG